MSIADNIKKIRALYDVTQQELANVAGVSGNAVSKWESGYSEPRMGAVERIAACYGLKKRHIIEDGGMDAIDPITKRPHNITYDSSCLDERQERIDAAFARLDEKSKDAAVIVMEAMAITCIQARENKKDLT